MLSRPTTLLISLHLTC
ncbi:unnamed protein product [Victoria cruziana]